MFYALNLEKYSIFKKRIRVFKRKNYGVIMLNIKSNKFNTKKLIKKYGTTFVMPQNLSLKNIRPYNTENFLNNMVKSFLLHFKEKEVTVINKSGNYLNLLLPLINKCKAVYIKTNDINGFTSLCKEAFNLYGTEPIFLESDTSIKSGLLDIDSFINSLYQPTNFEDKKLKGLCPLQLKAAFYENT